MPRRYTRDSDNKLTPFNVSGDNLGNHVISAHMIPTQNDQFDIGSAEYKIRDLYLSNNSVNIGDMTLSNDEGSFSVNGKYVSFSEYHTFTSDEQWIPENLSENMTLVVDFSQETDGKLEIFVNGKLEEKINSGLQTHILTEVKTLMIKSTISQGKIKVLLSS